MDPLEFYRHAIASAAEKCDDAGLLQLALAILAR